MTIRDLKERLEDIINELEDYDEEEEIKVVSNTYHLKDKNNFLATTKGFIDLSNPIDLIECEWCGYSYTKRELTKGVDSDGNRWGYLCEQCYKYLCTKGEHLSKSEED